MTRDFPQFFPPGPNEQGANPALPPLQVLGWQPYFSEQVSAEDLTKTPPVRIVKVHRSGLHVVGDSIDTTVPPRADATVGDWLLLNREAPSDSTLLIRSSLIKRRAPGTDRHEQLIAANIDTAFIVTSCNQDFNVARLERYIALAFDAEIVPVILLTKSDLASDPQEYITAARAIAAGIEVLALDARGEAPKTQLARWCQPGKTVAFLGSSGVGKSTLTNALLGSQSIETQAVRDDDAKGRHTTTRRELHPMPNGCLILDTPGMRELQLSDAVDGINDLFSDLQQLSTQCRFNDCKHETEPGCAVRQAIQSGDVDAKRFDRWRKLIDEDAYNSASLFERRAQDKAFGKMVKGAKKAKKTRK